MQTLSATSRAAHSSSRDRSRCTGWSIIALTAAIVCAQNVKKPCKLARGFRTLPPGRNSNTGCESVRCMSSTQSSDIWANKVRC